MFPVANPGNTPTEISGCPPGIPARLPPGSCRDFGRRDPASRQESRQDSHRDPAEILAAGNPVSRQESRQDSRRDPAKILAAGNPVSRQESRQDSRRDPAEILAAGNPVSRQESRQDSRRGPAEILAAGNPAFPPRIPVRIPAGTGNPGGQNLGGIPAGILAGSWQDPAKIPVPFLQG